MSTTETPDPDVADTQNATQLHNPPPGSLMPIEEDLGLGQPGDAIHVTIGERASNIAVGKQITQIIGFTADQVEALIVQVRRTSHPSAWDGRKPYLGLAAFQEADADFFFGREKLVDELLERVKEARFVCIAGPSGSGKSSLAQAGLLQQLRQGRLDSSQRWLYATLSPRGDPIEQLALAMARVFRSLETAEYLRKHGLTNPNALYVQATTLVDVRREGRLVVYVDQFEEVFTQTKDEMQRVAFLDLLTAATQYKDSCVTIVISMRSDFVSQCAAYPQLRALISQQFQLVGAMEPEELARAIIMPTLAVGAEIEPVLVAQVIADMKGEPGALPLMQFALKDLFDAQPRRKGDTIKLTLADYLARGGIQEALERHADAVFGKLDAIQQQIARNIFSHLIEVGRGTVDTRRTAGFAELAPLGVEAANVETVVGVLAGPDVRLLTTDVVQASAEAAPHGENRTVTIAHEKLIEAWPWLRTLVNENREIIALQNQIDEDAQGWENSKRDPSYLYTGARLAISREQLVAKKLTLSRQAHTFVAASIEAEEKRQRRQRQTFQRIVVSLAAAVLIFAVLAGWATIAQQRATRSQATAQAEVVVRRTAEAVAEGRRVEADAARATADANAEEAQRQTGAALAAQDAADASAREAARQALLAKQEKTTAEQEARRARAGELATKAQTLIQREGQAGDPALLLAREAVITTWSVDNYVTVNADAALRMAVDNTTWNRTLLTPDNVVFSAAFSPDGQTIASAGSGGPVRLWDAATGKLVRIFEGHTNRVSSVAFSPDGQTLVSASEDNTVRLWAATTGVLLHTLEGHEDKVNSVAFSPDGQTLVSASEDNTVRLWATTTGALLHTLEGHESSDFAFEDEVYSAAFSPDGQTIVSSGTDGTVRLWDTSTGKLLRTREGQGSGSSFVAFSPDGQTIISALGLNVQLWRASDFAPLKLLTGHTESIYSATFSPDGQRIVSAGEDGTVRLWNTATGDLLRAFTGHKGGIATAAFSPDGQTVVSAGLDDSTVRLWGIALRGSVRAVEEQETRILPTFSPDRRTVVSIDGDGTIRLWDADTGTSLRTLEGHKGGVATAAFSPDGQRIISTGAEDKAMRLWDVRTGDLLRTFTGHENLIYSVEFSSDGQMIMSVGAEDFTSLVGLGGTIRLWDADTGTSLRTLEGHKGGIATAAFSPDGQRIISTGAEDKAMRLWDVRTGDLLRTFTGHENLIYSATFSLDGQRVVSASEDGTVRLWDTSTGKLLRTLEGHKGGVAAAAFSPDGQLIVSAGTDSTVRLWDADTGTSLRTLEGHTAGVLSAVFTPDGRTILSVSSDRTLRLWVARIDDLLALAEARIQRSVPVLTTDERRQFGLTE